MIELAQVVHPVSFGSSSHSYEREINMLTFKENKGQGLVEYALILVLVAVVVIVILALLGPAIGNVFSNIVNAI
jgi:pilus assembly protein Flp/PilA